MREAMSRSILLDMHLVDVEGLVNLGSWGRDGSRAHLAQLVAIVLLELWLDQTFGSGQFTASIEAIFERHVGGQNAGRARP